MKSLSLLLVILAPLTPVMHLAALAQAEPDLGTDEQREAGSVLYMDKCAQCHGDEGRGDGIAEAYFRPMPRDFTAGVFKVRTTASGELPTDADLKRIIREGMPYTGMPPWPALSDRDITNLVYFIKTFNDDFSGAYGVPEEVDIPDPPRSSEESIARGREVYIENQCFDCHGDIGRGDGPSAPTLEDQWDNHIRPADLTKRWTFIGGVTRRDIYRTFTTGLDGSPMPSYTIDPIEDRWALVDYVYSLSDEEPNYGTVVWANPVNGSLDFATIDTLFRDARGTLFPVVGQVIEPGRAFMPGVDAIEVKAIYNADEIAFQLKWHDMAADTGPGRSNSPSIEVAEADSVVRDTTSMGAYSDAVAIQIPSEPAAGTEKPYFIFGDAKRSVDLWFADLAADSAQLLIGRGTGNITEGEGDLSLSSRFEDGEWTTVFKRPRVGGDGISFEEDTFVPIAFSVWDGFNEERGSRRGLTSWYHVYVEPADRPSALIPMLKWGVLTLLVQVGLITIIRRRHRRKAISA